MSVKIELALGGSGARGLAHIGVLKVFEKENIPIYQVTGCNMGAIIGGTYAFMNSAQKDIFDHSTEVYELSLI